MTMMMSQVEEERDNLQKKIMQMESDLDQVQEGLQEATTSLEEAEKSKTQVQTMYRIVPLCVIPTPTLCIILCNPRLCII